MLIAAIADVHAPQFFQAFKESLEALKQLQRPDLFLLAGDMVERGCWEWYGQIVGVLRGFGCPIFACFGNTEWIPDAREQIKQACPEVKFLDDECVLLDVKGIKVGIVGTIGSLDVPTSWQSRNIPNVLQLYRQRAETAARYLRRLDVDFKILLMHYAPSYTMLEGESSRSWGSMASKLFERVALECRPNLVIHGHSHRGKRFAWLDRVPVYNAAFTLHSAAVLIDTQQLKAGVLKFI